MSKAAPLPLGATLIRKGESAITSTRSLVPEAPLLVSVQVAPVRSPKLGTIAVTVRLDPERYERLKSEASTLRRTNQDIIVEALDARWRM